MKANPKDFDIDSNAALNRLADARGITPGWGRDAALARELSVSAKRISAWRDRDTMEHPLIILKCREWGLSINWVYFGDGAREVIPAPPMPDKDEVIEELLAYINTFYAGRKAANASAVKAGKIKAPKS